MKLQTQVDYLCISPSNLNYCTSMHRGKSWTKRQKHEMPLAVVIDQDMNISKFIVFLFAKQTQKGRVNQSDHSFF